MTQTAKKSETLRKLRIALYAGSGLWLGLGSWMCFTFTRLAVNGGMYGGIRSLEKHDEP